MSAMVSGLDGRISIARRLLRSRVVESRSRPKCVISINNDHVSDGLGALAVSVSTVRRTLEGWYESAMNQ